MKILFISSGKTTLSDLTPSIISAFRKVKKENKGLQIHIYLSEQEHVRRLIRKVERVKPDIILIFGNDQHPFSKILKPYQIPIGLWVVNDPYSIANYVEKAKEYDFVITEETSCIPFYVEKLGKPCIHFPLAVNPRNYYPMKSIPKYDICFIGLAWPTRLAFFNKLIPSIMDKDFLLIGTGWEKLALYREIKDKIYPDIIKPNEAAKIYNESKIVLNIHREPNDVKKNPYNLPAFTPNNRTFDIAATRAFQLITHREELEHYFPLNKEIVSFQDVDDLAKKINIFLKNNSLRERIAGNAYKRVCKQHTYYHRVKKLVEDLEKLNTELTEGKN